MKKSTLISLIVAGALIMLGVCLFAYAMTTVGWDFSAFSGSEFVSDTHEITEPFAGICIDSDTADITFVLSNDGTCRVECRDMEYIEYRVEVQNGTLCIEGIDTRAWYEHISIGTFESPSITVYLPENAYGMLTVRESTGDIEIPDGFTFESLELELSTGDVTVGASVKNTAKITTDTGDITVQNASVGALELTVSTGKIEVSGVDCAGNVTMHGTTGKAFLTDLTCKSLITKGSTGDILLDNVIAADTLGIDRSTGDVSFDSCDAANITVTTDTGDVRGTLCSGKVFACKTDTGRIDLPDSTTGGVCSITTDTGDISISIVSG